MSKLIFKELYLFSPSEKKAKKVSFSPKKTIITSSANDGTDRGKSVIMKSLYHTMGADCEFEGKWDSLNKTYNQVAQSLNTLRQKLVELRNQKSDLEFHIHALKLFGKENERQIETINCCVKKITKQI